MSPRAPLWITQRPSVFLAVFGTSEVCQKPGQLTVMCLTLQQLCSALVALSLFFFFSLPFSNTHTHTNNPSLMSVSPLVCGLHINCNIKSYKAQQNDTITTPTWHFILPFDLVSHIHLTHRHTHSVSVFDNSGDWVKNKKLITAEESGRLPENTGYLG